MISLDSHIEAILFFKSEPLDIKEVAIMTGKDESEIRNAVSTLEDRLSKTGLRLVRNGDSIAMGTAPELGEFFKKLQKEELNKTLGKASLETLTIILYQSPVSKSEIDYVRGVNSGFILRNLLIRGLIEREVNPKDRRTFLYSPTFNLLSHMGLSKISELPEYENVRKEIEEFKRTFYSPEEAPLSTQPFLVDEKNEL